MVSWKDMLAFSMAIITPCRSSLSPTNKHLNSCTLGVQFNAESPGLTTGVYSVTSFASNITANIALSARAVAPF